MSRKFRDEELLGEIKAPTVEEIMDALRHLQPDQRLEIKSSDTGFQEVLRKVGYEVTPRREGGIQYIEISLSAKQVEAWMVAARGQVAASESEARALAADTPLVMPSSAQRYFLVLDMIDRPWLVEVVVAEGMEIDEGVIIRALEISDWDRPLRDKLVQDGQINAKSARNLLDEFLETPEERFEALDDLRPHQDVISLRIAEEFEVR